MKPKFKLSAAQQANVLLISLFTAAILGTILASYLMLTQSQNISIMRSQAWNSAIALAEAGVEEALAHLNRGAPYFDPGEATNNLACNGWTAVGGAYVSPVRFLGYDYYVATITFNGLNPVIFSTGVVAMATSYAYSPYVSFATLALPSDPRWVYKTRIVKTETKVDSLFNVAMAAKDTIDLKGKNITTDSFDSADPNYSDNGLYPIGQVNKTKDNGDVCTDSVIVDSLNIGNARVKGKAKTGPGGTIAIGPNGAVGSRAWVESGKKGIEPGWSANDFNVYFPDVRLPNVTWFPAPGGATINGVYYDQVFLASGNYFVDKFEKVYVGTNANVQLWVTGNNRLAGNGDIIRIAPVGASLKLYVSGGIFRFGGQGVVNESGRAENFCYYGLPSNTVLAFSGNASFTGCIYAPNAAFTLGGGGNDVYDFVGASVTRTVVLNGHFNFHYDENLARVAGHRGFIPTRWVEK